MSKGLPVIVRHVAFGHAGFAIRTARREMGA